MSVVEARGLTKRFGAVVALKDVSCTFRPGEIHAVLGENGAGKSTLVGALAGFVLPEEGEILLDGRALPLGKAFECKACGIEMIHQHFTLVPDFTVAENLALARLPALASVANPKELAAPAIAKASELGWDLDPDALVRGLAVGAQQRIEILKALAANAQVLVLDEPTAVLTPAEVQELFAVLRSLRSDGKTIVLIAHKLSEIMDIADRFTVLRVGRVVGEAVRGEVEAHALATWMVGDLPPLPPASAETEGRPGISAHGLTILGDRGETAVDNLTFKIMRGEILGIGGVDGNGQIELAEAVAAVRPPSGGSFNWEGKPLDPSQLKIAYIPQDRQVDGLALNLSVQENLTVTGQNDPAFTRGPFLRTDSLRKWARGLIAKFEIRASGPSARVGGLSGGNQQKVVVARALAQQPDLVVAVNPTRGLDLRATQYVREKIRDARDGGAAVALFTTDLDELYALSTRKVFMSRGRFVEALDASSLVGGLEDG